jgi:Spy/CpxP family protein refolding chaperone
MKKSILALAIISMISFAAADAYAWGWGWGHHRGYGYHHGYGQYGHHGFGNLEFMKEELNLSDSQIEKIIKIDSEYRAKYFENRYNYDKLESLRIEHQKAIENVLTKSQREKLNRYNGYGGMRGYDRFGY